MSQKLPPFEPRAHRLLDRLGWRGTQSDSRGTQSNPERDEEGQRRIEQLVRRALDDGKDTDSLLSLLRDAADGQLAVDEVWKLLSQLSTSPDEHDAKRDQREALKRVLLRLIAKFGTLPVGPVFTEAIHICPDPSQHSQTDLKPTQARARDPEVQARAHSFIAETLRQGDGADPVGAFPKDVNGQDVIDESWNMLTSGDLPDDERDKTRRLCLKLVLGLRTIPAAMELPHVEYEEKDLLGTGSFADVFRGRSRGAVVAVKRLREFTKMNDDDRQEMLKSLHREAFLWKLLDHPYILPLLGVSNAGQRERMVSLVSPLAANGGIRDYIRKLQSQGELPASGPRYTKTIYHLLHQISVGLVYLHGQGIVHGDLHCRNILINAAGDVQLTDFGLALIADATSYNYASVHGGGALFTRAPELLDPQAKTTRQTTACDVYAFAFLCIELLTGQRAFPDDPEFHIIGLILKGRRPQRPRQLENDATHDLMWSLIVACWATLPEWRPIIGYVSDLIQRIIEYANGKFPPAFASQEIWRFDRSRYQSGLPRIIPSHDCLLYDADREISIMDIVTRRVLSSYPYRFFMHAECIKRVMVTSIGDDIEIRSLVTGKFLHVFGCGSQIKGLSISNPEMVDAEDLGGPESRDPARAPLIVACQMEHILVLTFPPLLHHSGGSKPKEVLVEDSPSLKHRLLHNLRRGYTPDPSWGITTGENIAAVFFVSCLGVWDIVAGERKWVFHEDGSNVDAVSVDVRRGIIAASFISGEASARIWDVHTGEVLHTLNRNHLVRTRCQQSVPSFLSLTDEGSLALWDPWSSPPDRLLLLARTPHYGQTYPIFVHNHNYALWTGNHGIDVADIRSGLMLKTLAIESNFEVQSLFLKGQICIAVLRSSAGAFKVVAWRLDINGDASMASESGGFVWSIDRRYPDKVVR